MTWPGDIVIRGHAILPSNTIPHKTAKQSTLAFTGVAIGSGIL
jgi:hypothetical protein